MSVKLFGVSVYVSVPFAILLAFLLVTDRTGLMSASILAMLMHEVGHLIVMKLNHTEPKAVKCCLGGILIIGSRFCTAKSSVLIALAGPIFNFLFSFAFLFLYYIFESDLLVAFAVVQMLLGAINLLPINGLDGGLVLREILLRIPKCNVQLVSKYVSIAVSVGVFTAGLAVAVKNVSNPSLLLLGIYLIIVNILKT